LRATYDSRPKASVTTEYDSIFLGSVDTSDQDAVRRALMRLFTPLEAVWSNVNYHADFAAQWARQRRACSKAHFDAYFRFSVGDETLPRAELDELIKRAGDKEFIKSSFRNALTVKRSRGATKAALLLDELTLHASRIPDESVQPLVTTIAAFAHLVYQHYHPPEGNQPLPESDCLISHHDADKLRSEALERIRIASRNGELSALGERELAHVLYRWRDFADDEGAEVKQWTSEQLASNEMVVKFAEAFMGHSWSQGMGISGFGDRVAKRSTRASVSSLQTIMDRDRFRSRIEELAKTESLSESPAKVVSEFLAAWKRHDANPNN
jgi:predicted KAP-like P-loop ATPase